MFFSILTKLTSTVCLSYQLSVAKLSSTVVHKLAFQLRTSFERHVSPDLMDSLDFRNKISDSDNLFKWRTGNYNFWISLIVPASSIIESLVYQRNCLWE